MAYNNKNHKKKVQHILAVYEMYQGMGIPDTKIVNNKLPEHGIHISYRTLMLYKGIRPSELA